ncbi:MAG: ComEA family DNA-binding protein [Prevotella sp.]
MRHIALIVFFAFLPISAVCQTSEFSESWQDIFSLLTDAADYDDEEIDDAYEILTTLARDRRNINDASIDDLRQIPFLPETMALSILNYRALYGPLQTMSEIQLIASIDKARRMILNAIFYAAPPSVKRSYWAERFLTDALDSLATDSIRRNAMRHYPVLDRQRHKILFTMNIPFYEREGYKDGDYLGSALSHTLRYKFRERKIDAALTAAQDAGEPFFAGKNAKGWDFYTGFVRLRNMGCLRSLVLGHYQMSYGMGLIMNNTYRVSRSSLLMAVPQVSTVLRGHASRQESNYLQGAAAVLAFRWGKGELSLAPFLSCRPLDGRFYDDSQSILASVSSTGYHRTQTEMARRGVALQYAGGVSVGYSRLPFRVAVNLLHVRLDHSLHPETNYPYRRFYPSGKNFSAASLSYSYIHPKLQAGGETAITERSHPYADDPRGVAVSTSNYVRWKFSPVCSVVALHRFYDYRFQSILGKSFGDMGTSANESGLYLGLVSDCFASTVISAYIDCVYHPWKRFGFSSSSRTWDTYVQGVYTAGDAMLSLRYRYTEKALAPDGSPMPSFLGGTDGDARHMSRVIFKVSRPRWTSQSQLHASYIPTSSDYGIAVSQGVGYKLSRWSLWVSLAYAYTTDYASRLYINDKAQLYTSMFNMMYGHSLRGNIILEAAVTPHVVLSARYVALHYFDRDTISSGLQAIDSPTQNDLMIQARISL